MDIFDLRSLVLEGKVLWTEHVALRLREQSIKRIDVIDCLQNGVIIEHYPDDMPYPSCLILGFTASQKPLHVVCGLNTGVICYVITSYYPSPDKWESDYKTRKAGE